jgi:hypothetical protein
MREITRRRQRKLLQKRVALAREKRVMVVTRSRLGALKRKKKLSPWERRELIDKFQQNRCNMCSRMLPLEEFLQQQASGANNTNNNNGTPAAAYPAKYSTRCRQCRVDSHNNRSIPRGLRDLFNASRHRARDKGWDFDLVPEDLMDIYLRQGGKCNYSGVPLEVRRRRMVNRFDLSSISIGNNTTGGSEEEEEEEKEEEEEEEEEKEREEEEKEQEQEEKKTHGANNGYDNNKDGGNKLNMATNEKINWFGNNYGYNLYKNRASLDRIDPKRGYTRDNVHLVCTYINHAKSDLSHEHFVELCRDIVNVADQRKQQEKLEYNPVTGHSKGTFAAPDVPDRLKDSVVSYRNMTCVPGEVKFIVELLESRPSSSLSSSPSPDKSR